MPLSDDEQATLNRLRSRLIRDTRNHTVDRTRKLGFRSLRAYYRGAQRLEQLGLAVPEDLRKFIVIVAWPRTYVDSLVSRLHPQGFLLDGEADADLWRIWQANNLDTEFRMALVDMLVYGRGYLCAGSNERDEATPLITVESPLQMVHEWSNRRRQVTAAARFYTEDVGGRQVPHATLYQPDSTIWLKQDAGKWVEDETEDSPGRDDHGLGYCPVSPLVNRASSEDRYGESEMLPLIGVTDAAARALTNAQLATERMGVPTRLAVGMAATDFKDAETGQSLTQWESYFGSIWATGNKDAKFDQFAAADLNNFKTIFSVWAGAASGLSGLPMRYLGQPSDNPPSADGIRAEEARIIGTAEEKQQFADGPIEDNMRTTRTIATGNTDDRLLQIVTDWRPAATPSQAQAADAAVKLHSENIYSRREALRSMGKSPQQIKVIEDEIAAETSQLSAAGVKAVRDAAGAGN